MYNVHTHTLKVRKYAWNQITWCDIYFKIMLIVKTMLLILLLSHLHVVHVHLCFCFCNVYASFFLDFLFFAVLYSSNRRLLRCHWWRGSVCSCLPHIITLKLSLSELFFLNAIHATHSQFSILCVTRLT